MFISQISRININNITGNGSKQLAKVQSEIRKVREQKPRK